jgi:hypothetical protein
MYTYRSDFIFWKTDTFKRCMRDLSGRSWRVLTNHCVIRGWILQPADIIIIIIIIKTYLQTITLQPTLLLKGLFT